MSSTNSNVIENKDDPPNLSEAPAYVKLAVDLIMLLEQNDIAADVAIEALEIVKQDCQRKLKQI